MAHRDFFSDEARVRAKEAVARVEAQTSAEVVITVRRMSGRYRDADTLAGLALAIAVLCVLLFHPQPFDTRLMPLDVLLGFAVGAAISTRSDTLRRALTTRAARRALVDTAAKAAFVDLGVSRTAGRSGLLVYVSMLERKVALVGDVALGSLDLDGALGPLDAAVRAGDFVAFTAAVEALGPLLAKPLPRAHDDVNELPDEVQA